MSKIRFITSSGDIHTHGVFTLRSDNWDDFGFKTSFALHYTTETGETFEIGYVKIALQGMTEGGPQTDLPREFSQLPENFFSLGQGREYYEALMKLPDGVGELALQALRDVAANKDIYIKMQDEKVFYNSLLREVPAHTVTMQFRRIVAGQAPLTPYKFYYMRHFDQTGTPPLQLEFNVNPDSRPPTNVHVLIGANGVGKSMLLRDFVSIASGSEDTLGSIQNDVAAWISSDTMVPFVNVVHVAFSAFDMGAETTEPVNEVKIHAVGLSSTSNKTLDIQFLESLQVCRKEPRRKRWISAIRTLENADPLLADMALSRLLDRSDSYFNDTELKVRFASMSSGHKIAILTVTRLIELVEEQSLVLLDEPETHLHPPLLSALTRAISDLVIDRNGVAIIATHSPVVLQEVPKSCVWRLQRTGDDLRAFRLNAESFGESVSRLTSEVFHLDVRRTGYHDILSQLVDQTGSVDAALEVLDGQLGDEGRFVLNSLAYQQNEDHV